jgi:hypothetical protein
MSESRPKPVFSAYPPSMSWSRGTFWHSSSLSAPTPPAGVTKGNRAESNDAVDQSTLKSHPFASSK